MKINRRRDHKSEVFTGSLSDIMFFLLLFFLIISTMVNPSVIQLMLPKASANVQKMNKQTLNLSVTSDLKYFLNDKPVAFEEIKPAIEGMVTPTEAATVILRADKSIKLQDLVSVLDIGHQLKVKMILATTKE